ncbi:MAG: hypothetical protein MPW16_18075 [Candidatus Manganitrophus sp.]|nr:MAG: hypothetical protein MPW16_18075 [Candidatus Manganitrophus sp.]
MRRFRIDAVGAAPPPRLQDHISQRPLGRKPLKKPLPLEMDRFKWRFPRFFRRRALADPIFLDGVL